MRKLITHPAIALCIALVGPVAAFGWGVVAVILATPPQAADIRVIALDDNALTAKAAVLYDPATHRILYQKNATLQLPLASLTKLMTAEVVLQSRTLDTVVRISAEDLKPEGDWGFKPGETRTLDELITYGLSVSSNDAMAAAAASLGPNYIEKMNSEAARLGLTQTHFLNPTGLDVTNSVSGAYGSAYDVARLAAAFYTNHPGLFAKTLTKTATVHDKEATATAEPLFDIPGIVGAKTGYTDLAQGNLVAVFDLDVGRPTIAVVLGSSHEGRFSDIRTLIEAARSQ